MLMCADKPGKTSGLLPNTKMKLVPSQIMFVTSIGFCLKQVCLVKCARRLYSSFLSVMVRLRKESETRAQNRGSGKGGVEERRKLLCSSANWTNLSYYTKSGLMHKTQMYF